MAYSPRYTTRSEVPVQVPDDYTTKEKNDALEVAERSLELDLNDGMPISEGSFAPIMEVAVKQKATCEMVKSADDPNSTKLGDLSDQGTNKQDFAETFCSRYQEIIEKILSSGMFNEDDSRSPYIYTTGM